MYCRHVTLQMKDNWITEFPRVIENEVLPLLRRQKGFLDEIFLCIPEKKEAVAISLWETKEHAEVYHREFYPEVTKILNKYIEGTPMVKPFEVGFTTLPAFKKFAVSAN